MGVKPAGRGKGEEVAAPEVAKDAAKDPKSAPKGTPAAISAPDKAADKADLHAELKAVAKAEPKGAAKVDAMVAPGAEAKATRQSGPKAKVDAMVDPQQEANARAQAVAKADKASAKAEKTADKHDARTEAKSEPRHEPRMPPELSAKQLAKLNPPDLRGAPEMKQHGRPDHAAEHGHPEAAKAKREERHPDSIADELWSGKGQGRGAGGPDHAHGPKGPHGHRDPDEVHQEMEETEDQIEHAAGKLRGKWKHADGEFRAKALEELLRNGKLDPKVRDEIKPKIDRIRELERKLAHAKSPEEAAKIEDEIKALTDEVAQVLQANGAELELLTAVERAAGEAGQPGSLTGLLQFWNELYSELSSLKMGTRLEKDDELNQELMLRQARADQANRAAKSATDGNERQLDRLRRELRLRAETA